MDVIWARDYLGDVVLVSEKLSWEHMHTMITGLSNLMGFVTKYADQNHKSIYPGPNCVIVSGI